MPDAVIFTGIQACGKTSYYHKYFEDYAHISLDVLNTRNREKLMLEECISEGRSFVIDNTDPTRADRERYIIPAKNAGYKIIGYYFRSSISECIERNEKREGKAKVPRTAVAHTHAILEMPDYSEGFDELYYVYMDNGNFVTEKWKEEKS